MVPLERKGGELRERAKIRRQIPCERLISQVDGGDLAGVTVNAAPVRAVVRRRRPALRRRFYGR